MYSEDVVNFKGDVPDRNQILNEVKRISGLDDLKWNENKSEFFHPDFTNCPFVIYSEGNAIRLGRGWIQPCYLLDATLTVLVNLGGIYDSQLPENGKRKWNDVRDKYPKPVDFTEFSNLQLDAEIKFDHVLPTPIEIANKVSELSGLSVSSRNINGFDMISHEIFSKNKVFMAQADNRVCLFGKGNRPNYMLEIAVASLMSLGGHYYGELANLTTEKWEKAKNKYPNQ